MENDIISRSALLQELRESRAKEGLPMPMYNALSLAIGKTIDAPTVDAVPVVRCGECQHEASEKPWRDYWNALWCERHGIKCQSDDFCKQGERRTSPVKGKD